LPVNDFLTWAVAPGANVQSQLDFLNDTTRYEGFVKGLLISTKSNKVWRQASYVSACIAQMMADTLQEDVLDDGNSGQFISQFVEAIRQVVLTGDAPLDGYTYGRQNGVWVHAVNAGGDQMSGYLYLSADPTAPMHAATKKYVDEHTGIVEIGDAPPSPSLVGNLWFDSVGLQLFVRYDDGNSVQWVVANAAGAGSMGASIDAGTWT
jgi:hypothetical protein